MMPFCDHSLSWQSTRKTYGVRISRGERRDIFLVKIPSANGDAKQIVNFFFGIVPSKVETFHFAEHILLILVHGAGGRGEQWQSLVAALSAHSTPEVAFTFTVIGLYRLLLNHKLINILVRLNHSLN